jgi:16S rRNA processing protein RimM
LRAVRSHGKRLLIRLEGADDLGAAQAYAGATLWAPREDVALETGEFLDADLAGCEVIGLDGVSYGHVDRVEHFPASDMLVVDGRLVPMVSAIVCEIDLHARRIVIDPPLGLLD